MLSFSRRHFQVFKFNLLLEGKSLNFDTNFIDICPISHHWFKWCLSAEKATRNYLNQLWSSLQMLWWVMICVFLFARVLTTKKGFKPPRDVEKKIENVVSQLCPGEKDWRRTSLKDPRVKYKVSWWRIISYIWGFKERSEWEFFLVHTFTFWSLSLTIIKICCAGLAHSRCVYHNQLGVVGNFVFCCNLSYTSW